MRNPTLYEIFPILLISIAVVGITVYFISTQQLAEEEFATVTAYHSSQYLVYAPFIEESFDDAEGEEIAMDRVLGGIVPHHIPTTISLLAEFYKKLKNTRDVETFVILGPDHVDASRGKIVVSKATFIEPFGELHPDFTIIESLEKSGLVVQDEGPFDEEHSIESQMLLISKIFPEAKVVPLLFRSDISNQEAAAFGKVLASIVDEDTFVVSSVDFSHYLSERQARPVDYLSANVLGAINSKSAYLVEADSEQALVVLMSFLETKGANHHVDLQVFNTRDFNSNSDYTTGYVTGFWGIENGVSSKLDNNRSLTLLFVGDIMLSRLIGDIMARNNDWRHPFLETADFLKNADLTFGNLEGPISARGIQMGSIYSFRTDPRAIEGLLYAGFDVLSIANNHIWDYGADAVRDTISTLEEAGIGVGGGGTNYTEAHQPFIKNIEDTNIAFLGYTNLISPSIGSKTSKPAIAYLDVEQAITDIKEAQKKADLVVVSLHWGNEYETTQNLNQEKIAKALIDAGAQLVIGHHPHVIQPVEEYNGGYIAYSLGNFVFDQNFSPDTKNGLVLRVTLKDKKISTMEQLKVRFTPSYQPYFLSNQNPY